MWFCVLLSLSNINTTTYEREIVSVHLWVEHSRAWIGRFSFILCFNQLEHSGV